MNAIPIAHARDADIRLSLAAMKRAAARARELAIQTGTELIVSDNGVIQRIRPSVSDAGVALQEDAATCKNAL